jgi:hypothetical protein
MHEEEGDAFPEKPGEVENQGPPDMAGLLTSYELDCG